MRQYRFLETKAGKIAFGIFLFVMLLLARDTLVTSSILGFNKSQILMLGVICVFGLAFLICNRRELKSILLDRRMLAILLAALILLLPMLVKRDWQMMYFSILLCLVLAFFLTYFTSYKVVARYFVLFLTVLGAYSVLATYGLRAVFVSSGMGIIPTFQNQIGVLFHNFGLAFVSDSYVKNRNFGIFREPGVYQYFIILALYLNNYLLSWNKQWKLWTVNAILAVTMLTTLATGGVVELGLLAVVVFFDKKLYTDKRACAVALALILLVGIFLAVVILEQGEMYWELYGMFVSKFFPEEDSFTERAEAIAADLQFFFHHPVAGEKLSVVLHAVANNTTSTLILFAVFGVGGGLLHVASWLALVWRREQKLWVNLSLLLILFMSFNTQNLVADVFFWLFPCMALAERVLPLLKLPEKKV